jgi:RNA 3'-terminal phosphate cyclase (ATP)
MIVRGVAERERVLLDGSSGEGGGQILRTGLALSAATGRPFEIRDIRARRPRPGLAAQHLAAVRAVAAVAAARVEGAEIGSRRLSFEPGAPRPGTYRFEIGTAGACSLVLQAVHLPLSRARGPSVVEIAGGTHVPWSPPFDELEACWAAWMERLDLRVGLELQAAGFYPAGGGRLRARIAGASRPRPLEVVERGEWEVLRILSSVCNLPRSIAERQARAAAARLEEGGLRLRLPSDAEIRELAGPGRGTAIAIVGRTRSAVGSASALGEPGKPAERVGIEAADAFLRWARTPAALDEHHADQVLLPLALAGERSVFTAARASAHLRTQADVLAAFVPVEVRLEPLEKGPGVRVEVIPRA